jgi:ATP-dependent DNA helicase RecQ
VLADLLPMTTVRSRSAAGRDRGRDDARREPATAFATATFDDSDGIVDMELFDRLRALRKRLADSEGVPAYIVFSDATLRGMARQRPGSMDELRQVSGVGPVKLARYGEAFLEEIGRGA